MWRQYFRQKKQVINHILGVYFIKEKHYKKKNVNRIGTVSGHLEARTERNKFKWKIVLKAKKSISGIYILFFAQNEKQGRIWRTSWKKGREKVGKADIRWITTGYPPDEIWFVANEHRAPFLANDRRAFPKCSVHLIDWRRRSTLIGHKSDLIRWISGISTGAIYYFPALVNKHKKRT